MKIIRNMALLFAAGAVASLSAGISDEPDGVSVMVDDNGGYKIISIASGTYDFNDPDDILDARKEAERTAKAGIAKFLKESLATDESASTQTSKVKKISSDGSTESKSVSKSTAKETLSLIRSSSAALLTGVVVLEDEKVPSQSGSGGVYRVMVGVSSATIGAATGLSSGMAQSQTDQAAAEDTSPVYDLPEGPAAAPVATPPQAGGSGLPPPPEGWVVCVGVGSGRKQAVQQALVEGISQIYGQMIQNDERMRERMTKIKMNANMAGTEMNATAKVSVKEGSSETLTKTAGFVREYRVIQVVPKDGNDEATVHALIVNPRAGGTMALMVKNPTMTVEDRTAVYSIGPKRKMSGAEIAKAVQFAMPNGLAKANKFLVLTDKSIMSAVENSALASAMVEAGASSASELMQAGQGLTPDFSVSTEISDIKYSKKMGQNKKTKKFEQIYKMTMRLNVTLVNERTGQRVKSDTITLSLDNDEIKGILEEDEDADLLQAVIAKLAEPIEEWMSNK